VVFEATTITSSARSCWNGTRGRDEGKSGCQQGDTQECREERRPTERVSSARARDLTIRFSSFGSIAQRVGRRALYRRPQRAARPRVSRPPRKNGFRRGKTVQKHSLASDSPPAAASVAGPKRVFPARCDIPTRAKLSRQKVMTANTYISRETGFFPVRGVASWQHHTLPLVSSTGNPTV